LTRTRGQIRKADKIHNLESFLISYKKQGDDKLWFEREMLKMFTQTWDHPIIAEYQALVWRMNSLV